MTFNRLVLLASALLAAEGKGPLPTFSAVGPDPEKCIETRAIYAASAMPGLALHRVNHAELEAYAEDLSLLKELQPSSRK